MADKMSSEIKKALPGIKTGVLLKNFTTYKIGGPAKYFFIAKNKEDLIKAVKTANDFKLPVFILGGGSNILVSDQGFDGLVIKNQISNIKNQKYKPKIKNIFAGAGVSLRKLVNFCAKNGLTGLEWAAGIPGITVGGAIYGHAQAFGKKISDIVKTVEAVNLDTFEVKNFSREQCQFSLKNSIFKKNKNLTIISAFLALKKADPAKIKKQIKENISYRETRHPLDFPSAGSMFVNPEVIIKDKNLLIKFPELAEYNKNGAMPAGYLITKCGLAGKKIGKAQISEKHGNFIVNLGGARAKDILALIILAKKKVKEIFNIDLEQEVQMVGFNHKT